jgi:hypothetical protein
VATKQIPMFTINQEIDIEIDIKLFDSEKELIGETISTINMSFVPKFQATINGVLTHKEASDFKKVLDITYIKIKGKNTFIEVFALNIKMSGAAEFKLLPKQSSLLIGKESEIDHINFYLTNLTPSLNKEVFEIDKWKVELNSKADYKEYKNLKKTSGFLITHEGTISRNNGSKFKRKDVHELITFLFLSFSFINGFNSCPFYLRGMDKNNNLIWSEISNNRIDPYISISNWYEFPKSDLKSFVEGFYDFFQNSVYKNHINEIIYWYIHSNRKGVDKSVILTHTALELISWLYLTQDKKNLSKDGLSKLNASDNFSLTLSSCGIPIEIPPKLKELSKMARGRQNVENACKAFSLVRNKLVHPGSKQRKNLTKSDLVYEAKILGCKFIELFILYKSGYSGLYFDRVKYDSWKGNADPVPWS